MACVSVAEKVSK